MNKLKEIERLRGIAVLMVLWQHMRWVRDLAPGYLRQGGSGVDLFFVISGFVVTRSLLRMLPVDRPGQSALERLDAARPALQAFFLRRLHRIGPMALLWALVPLLLGTFWARTNAFGNTTTLAHEVLAIVTLQYNYALAYGNGGKLAYYWSLAVEEHFYLLLPFILVFCSSAGRRMAALLAGIALVVFFLRPYLTFDGPSEWAWAYRGFVSHRKFDFLFAGALLSLMVEQGWLTSWGAMSRAVAAPLTVLLAFVLMVSEAVLPGAEFWNGGQVVLWAVSAVLVLLASFDRGLVFALPGLSHALEWVGSRSYGLYLIHYPMNWVLEDLSGRADAPGWLKQAFAAPWVHTAMLMAVSFTVAELCYRYLEQPLIRRGHRVTAPLLVRAEPPAELPTVAVKSA